MQCIYLNENEDIGWVEVWAGIREELVVIREERVAEIIDLF